MKIWSKFLAAFGSIAILFGAGGAGGAVPRVPDHTSYGDGVELSEVMLDHRSSHANGPRFKGWHERGRPHLFGRHGRPRIGAPGKSGY